MNNKLCVTEKQRYALSLVGVVGSEHCRWIVLFLLFPGETKTSTNK